MAVAKEKTKKAQLKRSRFLFLFLWLIGHVLAWGALIPVLEIFQFALNDFLVSMLIAVIVGGVSSVSQYLLIRWQFGRNIKAWIPLSMGAWLLSMLIIHFFFLDLVQSTQIIIMFLGLLLFAPAALVQTFLLRKHIQQAWLWLLACIAGTATFTLPIAFDYGEDWTVLVGYGLYASATALTLLWLFGMSATPIQQKAKEKTDNQFTDTEDVPFFEQAYLQETEEKRKLSK